MKKEFFEATGVISAESLFGQMLKNFEKEIEYYVEEGWADEMTLEDLIKEIEGILWTDTDYSILTLDDMGFYIVRGSVIIDSDAYIELVNNEVLDYWRLDPEQRKIAEMYNATELRDMCCGDNMDLELGNWIMNIDFDYLCETVEAFVDWYMNEKIYELDTIASRYIKDRKEQERLAKAA